MYDPDYEESKLYEDEETDIPEDDGEFYVDAPPFETVVLNVEIPDPYGFDTDKLLDNSNLNPDIYQDFSVRRFVNKSFRQCVDYLGFEDDVKGEHSEERADIINIGDNDVRVCVKVIMTDKNKCRAEFAFYVDE